VSDALAERETLWKPAERPRDMPASSKATWVVAAAIIVAATLLHLYLAVRFPLSPDEAYYWQWSRHLALGYYDQGPMVAWWIRASCWLFGETTLGIRAGIVVAALATQLFVFLLARDLFGPRVALLSLIPSTLTPLALAGGFVATYDPLVVLFWAACLYFASRAIFFRSGPAWLWLGISFGLGLLSKHTMVLLAPCLLLFAWTSKDYRALLAGRGVWSALAVALVVFSPNLWWQSQHGWMTFAHLFLLAGKGLDQPFARRLGDFAGSQVGLMTPLLFFLLIAAMVWSCREGRRPGGERVWFLFWSSGPVLLLFLLMTVKSKVQANWAVCGWLTPPISLVLWADYASRESGSRSRTRWRLTVAAMAFAVFLSAVLIWPEVRPLLHVNVPYRWDQMNKLYGGAELAAAADPMRRAMERETGGQIAVGAVTYDNASRLAFYMTSQPDTCCLFPGTRLNSYVLWNNRTLPRPGGAMLLADDYPPDEPKLAPFRRLFDHVECDGQPIQVYRRGVYAEPVHTFYLYRCYGYHPNPAVEQPSGG
jgi:4-amino-4-deoxy-L-arabinose transferase-like glycosyltransferase